MSHGNLLSDSRMPLYHLVPDAVLELWSAPRCASERLRVYKVNSIYSFKLIVLESLAESQCRRFVIPIEKGACRGGKDREDGTSEAIPENGWSRPKRRSAVPGSITETALPFPGAEHEVRATEPRVLSDVEVVTATLPAGSCLSPGIGPGAIRGSDTALDSAGR